MTAQPKPPFWERWGLSAFAIVLLLIAIVAAVPRLLLGAHQFIEYDGYWHVFIAQQDTWPRFWEDVYNNAHPPLFFLLLKAVLVFGRSLLVYRSISLLSGIVSVAVVGWIARKVTGSEARAYQSAIVYGLALSGIVISCEVRSYMLSMLFVLLSFSSLLEIPGAATGREEARARVGFAIWAILACLSEYFAFFYCGAALLLLFGWWVAGNLGWAKTPLPSKWWVELLTAAPVLGTVAVLYFGHAGHLAGIQGHLLPYYFNPKGTETVAAFVVRNSRNFMNLFLPFEVKTAVGTIAAALLAIGACAAAAFSARRSGAWTMVISGVMIAEIALAGIAGKYPFGGDLRQQFLLFPFLVLCLAIVVGWAARRIARGFRHEIRLATNAGLALVAAAICIVEFVHYPKTSVNVLAPQMAAFDRLERKPAAVYLDQFNLITFFIYHHDWKWTAEREQPLQGIDIFRLRKDGSEMIVFRDKTRWNIDPDEAPLYAEFAKCLRARKAPELSIFSVRQEQSKAPFTNVRGVHTAILQEAANSGVCVENMAVTQLSWYVTLRNSGCRPFELPYVGEAASSVIRASAAADDADGVIQYVGMWGHGNFEGARAGTLSYSNDAGAVARAAFEGPKITWVYTKAFNRGVAEVRIDGTSQGKVDLYSRTIVWQVEKRFRALGSGKHTLEIVVTGDKSPEATDRVVDVDALVTK